jgi:hypothetical protein
MAGCGALRKTMEARADGIAEKFCTFHCGVGTIQCAQDGGSTTYCGGFGAGCIIGCKLSF